MIKTEASIRKQRQETLYKQREKRRKFIEIMAWTLLVHGNKCSCIICMLLKAAAKAEQLITCRLAAYEKVMDGEWVCLYKGANNTQDVVHLGADSACPREVTCKYDPKSKPVNIKDVLNAIKEAMN